MLEKPDIKDELIISRLQEEYGLHVDELHFRSSGDLNTAAYDLSAGNGTKYFLKLRKGFDEIIVTVPLLLKSQGIENIIVPYETKSKQYWADFEDYKIILYPFIESKNGFEMELSDQHKRNLGRAIKAIHSTQIPPKLERQIPKETFSPQWRERVKSFPARAEAISFQDFTVAKLAVFMKSKQNEINHLVGRAEQLASELQAKTLKPVLCHSDIHGRNILITENDQLYIVDWDNPILASKERDLMFIGGGIDNIWQSEQDEAVFYVGYGKPEIDLSALAYYRYERVIQDLADYGEQVLLSDKGSADREQFYRYFISNIEPGNRVEIAKKTDELLTNNLLL
jgi:spectinomycin phosphotransferase